MVKKKKKRVRHYFLLSESLSSRHLVINGSISSSQLRPESRAQPWKFATKSPSE